MWRKLLCFYLKQGLCSRTHAWLIFLVFCLTISGLMAGQLKYKEMMVVTRGNEKVVTISDTGTFFTKMENILDRTFRYDYGEANRQAQYRFVFSRLTDLWPIMGFVLVLVYGYHFLTREKMTGVVDALRSGPVSLQEYYWAKAASGAIYFGVLNAGYALMLFLYALIKGGGSTALFVGVVAGVALFWGYCMGLWALYLLISFGVSKASQAGILFLTAVLVIGVVIPAGVQGGARLIAGQPPKVPYFTASPGILAFVPERERTEEERAVIGEDQQELVRYYRAVHAYLKKGMAAEERLGFFSPFLLFYRLEKTLFRPELADIPRYLDGIRGYPTVAHFLHCEVVVIAFLTMILFMMVNLPPLFMRNAEWGFKRSVNISQKNAKPA